MSGPVTNSSYLIDIGNGKFKKVLTLAFILKGDEVLLGLKKRGFGKGLWNGFGGKVDPGEEIVDAAAREVKEECGLDVETKYLEKFAEIEFEFKGDPVILEVHAFKTSTFSGEVTESDEMLPKWYQQDCIPSDQMWPDDKVWYPLFLKGNKFRAYFHFEGHEKIMSYIVRDYEKEDIVLESLNWPEDINSNIPQKLD